MRRRTGWWEHCTSTLGRSACGRSAPGYHPDRDALRRPSADGIGRREPRDGGGAEAPRRCGRRSTSRSRKRGAKARPHCSIRSTPRIAWVAACHHRTSSRISWDLFSSADVRLEPLFASLLPALADDERLPAGPAPALLGRPRIGRRTSRRRRCSSAASSRTRSSRRWRREGVTVGGRRRRAGRRVRGASRRHAGRRRTVVGDRHRRAARVIDAARAWPPGRRRCARRWRRS